MMEHKMTYSSAEAATMAAISYRQLDYWLRTGKIQPSFTALPGSGRTRRWTPDDVERLCAVAEALREAEQVIVEFDSGRLWQAQRPRAKEMSA